MDSDKLERKIEVLEERQQLRREHIGEIVKLMERRQLEIDNLRAQLAEARESATDDDVKLTVCR